MKFIGIMPNLHKIYYKKDYICIYDTTWKYKLE